MTTRVFTLSGGVSSYGISPADLQAITAILNTEHCVRVVYPLRIKNPWKPQDEKKYRNLEVQGSVDILKEFLRPFGDFKVLLHEVTGTDSYVHVHVLIESNVIHFEQAPWHPSSAGRGGADRARLVEMMRRQRPFVATYIFDDQPNHREDGPGTLYSIPQGILRDEGFAGFNLSIVRRDWPIEMFKGKCRIDILIEPRIVILVPVNNTPGEIVESYRDGNMMEVSFDVLIDRLSFDLDRSGCVVSPDVASLVADWLRDNGIKEPRVEVQFAKLEVLMGARRLHVRFRQAVRRGRS